MGIYTNMFGINGVPGQKMKTTIWGHGQAEGLVFRNSILGTYTDILELYGWWKRK